MISQYEAMIGLRYVRARRRNHFISFISMSSMIGVALGVAALITVISVMNGFEKELKDRILGMASHAVIEDFNGLNNWERVIREVKQHPDIDGAAPYLHAEGMLTRDNLVNGVIIRGVLPNEEINDAVVADKMVSGSLSNLEAGKFNIILGSELVRNLGIKIGDKVTLVAPQANLTPAGIMPRLKRFKLIGIFDVGMHEFDSGLALIHMEDS